MKQIVALFIVAVITALIGGFTDAAGSCTYHVNSPMVGGDSHSVNVSSVSDLTGKTVSVKVSPLVGGLITSRSFSRTVATQSVQVSLVSIYVPASLMPATLKVTVDGESCSAV